MAVGVKVRERSGPPRRRILFKLVESQFFSEFDGEWGLDVDEGASGPGTRLSYEVFIRPNGPVPVMALEWRIKEDVPVNLLAVKAAAELLLAGDSDGEYEARAVDWEDTETLGGYVNSSH
jgi:hypothetical protein